MPRCPQVLTGGFFALQLPAWISWLKWISYIFFSLQVGHETGVGVWVLGGCSMWHRRSRCRAEAWLAWGLQHTATCSDIFVPLLLHS